MTGNRPHVLSSGHFGQTLTDVSVTGTMKSPTFDVVVFGPFKWNAVKLLCVRNRLMKSGFERCHQRDFRKFFRQLSHRCDIRRIVSRSNGVHLFHFGQDFRVNPLDTSNLATMNRFETDRRDFGRIAETPGIGMCQLLQPSPDRFSMIGHMNG